VRHSYSNETLLVFKCRSTTTANINDDRQASRTGSRLTRVGHILRSSGIEGLPQLINVLRGEMSIVGPCSYAAPPREMFQKQILQISRRGNVRPGLTGWAQVNGCWDESDSSDVMRRIEYDLHYVENWSFLLDMKIILITLCSKKRYALTNWTTDR
jgi:lipopolysaccharide/colanic/teichoic acid biosynthesis glycosyltransferase